ncbi:MAG: hypothetical protein JWN03_4305 [Nocardia sp.]|nr:hypothetical protein [Nocardia sp.]
MSSARNGRGWLALAMQGPGAVWRATGMDRSIGRAVQPCSARSQADPSLDPLPAPI